MSQKKHRRHVALDLLKSVCSDVGRFAPELQLEPRIALFYNEVEKRVNSRGDGFLFLELPELGKKVDKGLSSGFFNFERDLEGLPFGRLDTVERVRASWLYRSLLGILFDARGNVHLDLNAEAVAAVRQLCYLFKKVRLECPSDRVLASVVGFLETDRTLREPTCSWSSDQLVMPHCRSQSGKRSEVSLSFLDALDNHPGMSWKASSQDTHQYDTLLRALLMLDRVSLSMTPRRILEPLSLVPKHGPGAVSDKKTGTDKYAALIWPEKLNELFPMEWFTTPNESFIPDIGEATSGREPPAKLLAVPKTMKGPRLITAEPTAHQFLQQGLLRWFRENIPVSVSTCVDFSNQDLSRGAVLDGSASGDPASIDLSEASDRLSVWTVERAFRSNPSLLRALHATRSRVVVDGTGTYPFSVRIRKFAGMGNAVTFPVQSIIYAMIAVSSALLADGYRAHDVKYRDILRAARKVRVFGDDILLPKNAAIFLGLLLNTLQLKVNGSKSHIDGAFRESCGMDAYGGYEVTPVYVSELFPRDQAESLASWVEVSNNFHRAGLWNTAAMMVGQLAKCARKLVVSSSDGPGLRLFTFTEGTRPYSDRASIRWNTELQLREMKSLVVSSKNKQRSRQSAHDLLEYFLQDPLPEHIWKHGYVTQKSTKLKVDWVPID